MTAGRPLARQGVLVTLALGVLYLAGRGRLTLPPVTRPSGLVAWWTGHGPVVAVFSAARLVLLAGGAYWLVLLALVGVVGSRPGGRLWRALARTRLMGVKRAMRLAMGASAFGPLVLTSAAPALASPAPGSAAVSGPAPTITNLAAPGAGPVGAPTLSPVAGGMTPGRSGPAAPAPGSAPSLGPTRSPGPAPSAGPGPSAGPASSARRASTPAPRQTAAPAPAAGQAPSLSPSSPPRAPSSLGRPPASGSTPASGAPAPPGASGAAATRWVVQAGDNLWTIAERTMGAAWGWHPSDRQVSGYWLSVIAANRSRLPDPVDPSLLFPGDVILLPPPPAPPTT